MKTFSSIEKPLIPTTAWSVCWIPFWQVQNAWLICTRIETDNGKQKLRLLQDRMNSKSFTPGWNRLRISTEDIQMRYILVMESLSVTILLLSIWWVEHTLEKYAKHKKQWKRFKIVLVEKKTAREYVYKRHIIDKEIQSWHIPFSST